MLFAIQSASFGHNSWSGLAQVVACLTSDRAFPCSSLIKGAVRGGLEQVTFLQLSLYRVYIVLTKVIHLLWSSLISHNKSSTELMLSVNKKKQL